MENLNKKDSILNATGKYEIQILFYLYQQFFDVVFMDPDPDFLDRIRIFGSWLRKKVRSGSRTKWIQYTAFFLSPDPDWPKIRIQSGNSFSVRFRLNLIKEHYLDPISLLRYGSGFLKSGYGSAKTTLIHPDPDSKHRFQEGTVSRDWFCTFKSCTAFPPTN